MVSKTINISWIITGSQPEFNITLRIVLQTVFHQNDEMKIIILITVLLTRAFGPLRPDKTLKSF